MKIYKHKAKAYAVLVKAGKYILSEEFDLCENCGEYTRVIIGERRITRCDKLIQKFFRLKK